MLRNKGWEDKPDRLGTALAVVITALVVIVVVALAHGN